MMNFWLDIFLHWLHITFVRHCNANGEASQVGNYHPSDEGNHLSNKELIELPDQVCETPKSGGAVSRLFFRDIKQCTYRANGARLGNDSMSNGHEFYFQTNHLLF